MSQPGLSEGQLVGSPGFVPIVSMSQPGLSEGQLVGSRGFVPIVSMSQPGLSCTYQTTTQPLPRLSAFAAMPKRAQSKGRSGPEGAIQRPARRHLEGAPATLPVPRELVQWARVCFRADDRGRGAHEAARLLEARGLSMGPGRLSARLHKPGHVESVGPDGPGRSYDCTPSFWATVSASSIGFWGCRCAETTGMSTSPRYACCRRKKRGARRARSLPDTSSRASSTSL